MTDPHPFTTDGLRCAIAPLVELDPATIGDDDNLMALGLDSMGMMLLAAQWQDHGLEVPFEDLADEPTIAAWAALLARLAGQPT